MADAGAELVFADVFGDDVGALAGDVLTCADGLCDAVTLRDELALAGA